MQRSTLRAGHFLAAALAALLATGCGGGGTDASPPPAPPAPPPPPPPPPPQGPSLRLVSGAGTTDTIEAPSSAPLVVEVHDASGQLRAGVGVRFVPLPAPLPSDCPGFCLPAPWVAPNGLPTLSSVTVATDAQGRVAMPFRFGTAAGEGKLVVTVPELSLQDTARFTITAGHAARVEVVPGDTAVSVGGSFSPRGGVVDRHGNPRPDAVTLTAGSSAVAVTGNVVSGVSPARTFVVAQLGAERDTGWVSVVPQGQVVVWRAHRVTGDTARLILMKLDGTPVRTLDLPFGDLPDPAWSPDGTALVVAESGATPSTRPHLAFQDLNDGSRRRVVDPAAGLLGESHPRYSRDGAWIYFTGAPAALQGRGEIWRVHPDGSGAARVGPPGGLFSDDYSPTPSSDGTKVAYQSSRGEGGSATLRILELATGVESFPGGEHIVVDWLEWSPADAQTLAIGVPDATETARGLRIDAIRPDGSGRHTISPPGRVYLDFAWSPDGRWLVAKPSDRAGLELIEVATGLSIPLPFAGVDNPVWKP
jgi:hypothetical protein